MLGGCFLLVLGPLYPLVHVNMHCRAVDGLQSHDPDQTPNPMSARMEPISRQICGDLAAAKERVFRKDPVDFVHQLQRLCIHTNRRVIQR